ncbi:octopamine receptor beta-2R isoform X2 [Eurytemora carolleeae]|uniref:octopamine receptor beta-2R isoform X2 n=1 Tax=Eurytemora carolleeae TaxID=1294199 RepID=UPI000C75EA56|nr:octopamine receptor beta-2R isoform X2 [Eurytemora carolleeae]|eukprot:XP_023339043.1 octopamine receptor beta-2R-like isoform X2 [Eurytemora affinis]
MGLLPVRKMFWKSGILEFLLEVNRNLTFRGINNYFLVSLAAADLLVAGVAMTLNATQEISGRWIFGSFVCDLWNSIDVHASTVSTLHLCCISLDRYYAIVRPLDYQSTITTRVAILMMIVAWLSPTIISFVPIFLGWYTTNEHIQERAESPGECAFIVNKPYAFISSTLTFWCPVIVMLLTYQRVYREAMRQKKTIERLNTIVNLNSRTVSRRESSEQENSSGRYRERTVSWREKYIQGSNSNMSNISEHDEFQPEKILRDKLKKHQYSTKDQIGVGDETDLKNERDEMNETKRNSPEVRVHRTRHSLGNVLVDVKARARLSIVNSTHAITEGLKERKRLNSNWRKEHKAFVTLGVVLGAFLACWLPFFTWYLTTTICGDACPCPPQVVSVLFWIGYFNSTLNPVIYAMTNQDFKLAFISILRRLFCCKASERTMNSEF